MSKEIGKRLEGNRQRALNLTSYLGIWLGKILASATRLAGRGGTTFPGRLSLKLAPGILPGLSRQITKGNIAITGTNGKTTTTALLAHILKTAGYSIVSNSAGSNLSWGIATSLIEASSWGGRLHRRFGVLEIDEGFFPKLAEQLQLAGTVVTNIFPDQLDRFGEVDNVRQSIDRGLGLMPAHCFQVLNADDPFLTSLRNCRDSTWYYGLEMPPTPQFPGQPVRRQGYTCPRCQQILGYQQVFLAHLGHYRCRSCGFERPRLQVSLLNYTQTQERTAILKLDLKGKQVEMPSPLPVNHNVYNVLAGITAALALGLPATTIKRALSSFPQVNGDRLQRVSLRDSKKSLVIALIKNAVGVDQALAQLPFGRGWDPAPIAQGTRGGNKEKISLLIAINDGLADGTDVSWIWNAGFEQLTDYQEYFYMITVSGSRAWDMAIRLKYAGLDYRRITVENKLQSALETTLQSTPPGKTVYILPNYTALAELNRVLRRLTAPNLRST